AIGEPRLSPHVRLQRHGDAKDIPGAVGPIGAASGADAVERRHGGEGMRHADRLGPWLQDQRMPRVEPVIRLVGARFGNVERGGGLRGGRWPRLLDEKAVDEGADLPVKLFGRVYGHTYLRCVVV